MKVNSRLIIWLLRWLSKLNKNWNQFIVVKNGIISEVTMESIPNFHEDNLYKIFEGFPLAVTSRNLN